MKFKFGQLVEIKTEFYNGRMGYVIGYYRNYNNLYDTYTDTYTNTYTVRIYPPTHQVYPSGTNDNNVIDRRFSEDELIGKDD